MKRILKWTWKWTKRAFLSLLVMAFMLYLFVLARSFKEVTVDDDDLYIETLAEPLDPPPTPLNVFDVLARASQKLWWSSDTSRRSQTDLLSPTNWDAAMAEDLLQKNQAALTALTEMEKLPKLMVPKSVLGAEMTYTEDWKKLSLLLSVQEKQLYQNGNVTGSYDAMFKHLRLCQQMADAHGPLIVYMIGCANCARVLEAISQSLAATNLSPAQLKYYADELGAMSSNATPIFVNALKGEYQCDARTLDDFDDGRYVDPRLGSVYFHPHWWWPVFNCSRTKALMARNSNQLIKSATSHYKDFDRSKFEFRPGIISWMLSGNAAGQVMAFQLIPMTASTFTIKCKSTVRLNATRTLMALRAYQLTHEKLPEKLADLVPEFLDQVPVDDFDGQPLRYSLENKIVYSVGENLKDDGGDDRGQEEWNSAQRHQDIAFHFDF